MVENSDTENDVEDISVVEAAKDRLEPEHRITEDSSSSKKVSKLINYCRRGPNPNQGTASLPTSKRKRKERRRLGHEMDLLESGENELNENVDDGRMMESVMDDMDKGCVLVENTVSENDGK